MGKEPPTPPKKKETKKRKEKKVRNPRQNNIRLGQPVA